jgi:hypothetical protein
MWENYSLNYKVDIDTELVSLQNVAMVKAVDDSQVIVNPIFRFQIVPRHY